MKHDCISRQPWIFMYFWHLLSNLHVQPMIDHMALAWHSELLVVRKLLRPQPCCFTWKWSKLTFDWLLAHLFIPSTNFPFTIVWDQAITAWPASIFISILKLTNGPFKHQLVTNGKILQTKVCWWCSPMACHDRNTPSNLAVRTGNVTNKGIHCIEWNSGTNSRK